MGIKFSGTVTDLRKAAASLIRKYAPNIHEKMALFLCHSIKAHDEYYRIKLGHDGLTETFNSLEKFQSLSHTSGTAHNSSLECPDDLLPKETSPTISSLPNSPRNSCELNHVSLNPSASNDTSTTPPTSHNSPLSAWHFDSVPVNPSISNCTIISSTPSFSQICIVV